MTNNKQQTSVEWLEIELEKLWVEKYLSPITIKPLLDKAKEMEKEQRSIELPSDEEISKEASVRHYGTNFKHVFASGAKWMRDKIQGGEQ
jgi:hypothetical protein